MDFWRGALLASLILSSIMVYPFSSSLAATTNSPPVLEPIGNLDEDEDDSQILMLFATDPDEVDILKFSSSPLPRFLTLVDNGERSAELRMETSLNDQGTYSITITVTDNGSPQLSDSETFTLTILNDGDPPSPDEAIQKTIVDINIMISDGKFSEGQATSLMQKLDAAAKKIESLQSSAADKILRAFINQVDAFVKSGQLTYDDGQILIEDIQIILYAM